MKPGTKITFTRRNGETATGKVVKALPGKSGGWLAVDIGGPDGLPRIVKIRESQAVPV